MDHVQACPECAELYRAMLALKDETQRMGDELPVPQEVSLNWRRAVRKDAAAQKVPRTSFFQKGWARIATVAAGLVLVVGLVSLIGGQDFSPSATSPVMQAQSGTIFRKAEDSAAYEPYADMPEEDAYYMEEMDAPSLNGAASGSGEGVLAARSSDESESQVSPAGTMLRRSAWYTLTTLDFDLDAEKLMLVPENLEGWVESQSLTGTSYEEGGHGRRLSLQLRVPAQKMDDAMGYLSQIGILVESSTRAEDVSEQYYDTKGRLESAQALQKQLQDLLSRADTVELLVEITKELNNTQYLIDNLSGSMRSMESRVNYSTIEVELSETRTPTIVTPTKVTLGQRMRQSFIETVNGLLSWLGNFAVGLVGALPWLIPLLVVLLVAFLILRRRFRK